MNPSDEAITSDLLRAAMRTYPTGVTLVTTILNGIPHGFTANAFTSVSLDPPSILLCVNRRATSHALIAQAGIFCINFLKLDQQHLADRFARSGDDHQFEGVPWTAHEHGAPRLTDNLAWLDCELSEEHSVSTHTIFVGRVLRGGTSTGRPLGYLAGGFHDFGVDL